MTNKRIHERAKDAGITKSLTREENEHLYQKVVTGDKDAIRKMIEGNMALVIVRVESFLIKNTKYEYLRDDLHSEGMLALTMAVNQMANKGEHSEPNPSGYIYVAIDNALSELASEEDVLCGSKRQMKRDRESGRQIPSRENFSVTNSLGIDPCSLIDLRESIYGTAETEEERRYIELAESGYSMTEIADRLGIFFVRLYELKRNLAARFEGRNRKD